ncbi:MAG: hypothetical protein H0Z34_10765 [Brevibacillus sp.]|nr:hypothetical protein [Brevibacillus sp.]
MLFRKFLAYILTSVLSTVLLMGILALKEDHPVIDAIGIVALVVFFVTLIYGVPVSVLADYLTKRFNGAGRVLCSLFIHLLFGVAFVFIVGLLVAFDELNFDFRSFWSGVKNYFIASTLTSFLFWASDEAARFILNKKNIS